MQRLGKNEGIQHFNWSTNLIAQIIQFLLISKTKIIKYCNFQKWIIPNMERIESARNAANTQIHNMVIGGRIIVDFFHPSNCLILWRDIFVILFPRNLSQKGGTDNQKLGIGNSGKIHIIICDFQNPLSSHNCPRRIYNAKMNKWNINMLFWYICCGKYGELIIRESPPHNTDSKIGSFDSPADQFTKWFNFK